MHVITNPVKEAPGVNFDVSAKFYPMGQDITRSCDIKAEWQIYIGKLGHHTSHKGLLPVQCKATVWTTGGNWILMYKHQRIFNSLALGKFEWKFRYIIFKRILLIDGWGISCKNSLIWMSLDFTDNQSTWVQVMAWCRQAASHYLSQC